MKKDEEREIIQKDDDKVRAEIQMENVQQEGMQYVFDAYDCYSNLSELSEYIWDFGDGTVAEGVEVLHQYVQAGEYTVTLTVKDEKGNVSKSERTAHVAKKGSGGVDIKVKSTSGESLSGALIYMERTPNAGKEISCSADEKGEFQGALNTGTYEISAYKSGYLPIKKKVKIVPGTNEKVEFTLEQKEVVTGTLSHRKLDMREIMELGVDLEDEDNWYIYKYEKITYLKGKPKVYDFYLPRGGTGYIDYGNGILSLFTTARGRGGENILIDYGIVSYLKQMFQVELTLTNHAEKGFTVTDGEVNLNLPEGLSLAGLTRSQSEKVSLSDIAGGSEQKVSWIIRGDKPGTYSISANFTGKLQPFNTSLSAEIVDKNPIEVTESNENTSTDPDFLDPNEETRDYQIAVTDLGGNPIRGAYIELAYDGKSSRSLTDSDGLGHVEVNKGDDRTFTLTVIHNKYPDYINDCYTINKGDYMDSVVLGGKNSDGNPYSEESEGSGNYDGDFTLQYADVNDESLASLKQTIDTNDGKVNTFTFSFSEKAASVSLYLKKDKEKKQITTVSNTLSKSALDAEIKVKSSQFKEGWNLYVKAVDAKTKTEHNYKLDNLSFITGGLRGEREIDISLDTSEKKGSVKTEFNPNWLTKDPKTYNHNLAQFAMALSSVAYCEGSGSEYGALENKNYYDALTKLGFTVEGGEKCLRLARYGSDKPTSKDDHQSIHYYLAHKEYVIEGEENDVVILTLRGTKGNEWYDNFDIDYDNTGKNCDIHDGFKNGADAMKTALTQYIKKNKLTKNTKILITGHSRGAAVTNLLAAELDKDKNMITDAAGKKREMKVFAYAYACPNTVATSKIKTEKKSANFDNIYNFVNPDDFVTKVVPSKWV